MRSLDDLKQYRLVLEAGVTLDFERLEQDPLFGQIARRVDASLPNALDIVVTKYLLHYLAGEHLLENMPATTGPADLYRCSVTAVKLTVPEPVSEPVTST